MANGIDAIYDPSDVSRMLNELRDQRIQMEEARARKRKSTTKAATSAWKMWSGEQKAKTKELLASEDYVVNPEFTEKGWLSRQFTPAENRVIPNLDPTESISLDKYRDLTGQTKGTGLFSKVAEKGSGWGGGIGAGLSLYETISDWDEHKKDPVKRGVDVAKTGLYAASMVPGPHAPFTLAGAGVLSLADLLWG